MYVCRRCMHVCTMYNCIYIYSFLGSTHVGECTLCIQFWSSHCFIVLRWCYLCPTTITPPSCPGLGTVQVPFLVPVVGFLGCALRRNLDSNFCPGWSLNLGPWQQFNGLPQAPYVAARLRFEPATHRTQDTKVTTEPPFLPFLSDSLPKKDIP